MITPLNIFMEKKLKRTPVNISKGIGMFVFLKTGSYQYFHTLGGVYNILLSTIHTKQKHLTNCHGIESGGFFFLNKLLWSPTSAFFGQI